MGIMGRMRRMSRWMGIMGRVMGMGRMRIIIAITITTTITVSTSISTTWTAVSSVVERNGIDNGSSTIGFLMHLFLH